MALKETVKETTGDVLENAEETVGAFADKAYRTGRAHFESAAAQQKNNFKDFCRTIVRALRRGGDEFRDEGYATVAGLVDDVAGKAEEMTEDIDDFDMRSAADRVEDFVRERPLVAYGALAIGGFLVANALQSASRHRRERSDDQATAKVAASPVARRKSVPAKSGPASRKKAGTTRTARQPAQAARQVPGQTTDETES